MEVYTHRVRYHEVDGQGYLFNARYLELTDVAMTELLRHLGYDYAELVAGDFDPTVVQAELRFRHPARFDDLVRADVTCTHIGTTSFRLHTALTTDERPIADIDLAYVNVDSKAETPRPLSEEMKRALSTVRAT